MRLRDLNLTLWKYSESTPGEKLYRHHRIFRYIALTEMWTCVAMMSSLALFLILGCGTVETIVLGAITLLALILIVPFIFSFVCLFEIEKVLQVKGLALPMKHPIDYYIRRYAMKMLFWAFLLILGPIAIRYLVSLIRGG